MEADDESSPFPRRRPLAQLRIGRNRGETSARQGIVAILRAVDGSIDPSSRRTAHGSGQRRFPARSLNTRRPKPGRSSTRNIRVALGAEVTDRWFVMRAVVCSNPEECSGKPVDGFSGILIQAVADSIICLPHLDHGGIRRIERHDRIGPMCPGQVLDPGLTLVQCLVEETRPSEATGLLLDLMQQDGPIDGGSEPARLPRSLLPCPDDSVRRLQEIHD